MLIDAVTTAPRIEPPLRLQWPIIIGVSFCGSVASDTATDCNVELTTQPAA